MSGFCGKKNGLEILQMSLFETDPSIWTMSSDDQTVKRKVKSHTPGDDFHQTF